MLNNALKAKLLDLIPDRRFIYYEMPYGQFSREIIEKDSNLNIFRPDIMIFTSRIEDLCPVMEYNQIVSSVKQYIKQIKFLNQYHPFMGMTIHALNHIHAPTSLDET